MTATASAPVGVPRRPASPTRASQSGSGCPPITLSTTIFSGKGASSAMGVDSRLSRSTPAMWSRYGPDRTNIAGTAPGSNTGRMSSHPFLLGFQGARARGYRRARPHGRSLVEQAARGDRASNRPSGGPALANSSPRQRRP